MSDIKALFQKAVNRHEQDTLFPALLGNGDGTTMFTDVPGFVWARVVKPTGATITQVRCRQLSPVYDAPVRVREDPIDKVLEVVRENANEAIAFFDGQSNIAGLHAGQHGYWGTDSIRLDELQYKPFLVHPTFPASLNVYVEPLVYDYNGARQTWAGGEIDLGAYIPTNPNEQTCLVVGLNKASNTLTIALGDTIESDSEIYFVPFSQADVDNITYPANFMGGAAVRLYTGMSKIQQFDVFQDVRQWLDSGGGGGDFTFELAADSGTPETVESGDTVTIAGGIGIETEVDTPDTVTLNLSDTSVSPGSYTYASLTVDAQGRLTAASNGTPPSGGTVTSVALSMPAEFSVAGSPITGAGTFTVSKANQSANLVFAGPNTGSPAAPTFRALVSDDIPNLDAAKITTGVLDNARVNWAAPGTIGSGTPNTGVFTAATVLNTSADSVATLNANAGQNRIVRFQSAGSTRWQMGADTTSEAGSNTGSDFGISGYDDSGNLIRKYLSIRRSDGQTIMEYRSALTTGAPQILNLRHTSSGTPAAGYGVSFNWQGDSSTNTVRNMADMVAIWVVATDGSRTVRLSFRAFDSVTAREGMRIEADGSVARIGFYGVTAVARPAAYTQTYSTTTRTVNPASTGAFTGINNAQAGTVYATVADLNQLRTDMLQSMQLHNSHIDDNQALGLAQ